MTHKQIYPSTKMQIMCADHFSYVILSSSVFQFYFVQADDLNIWERSEASRSESLFETIMDNFSEIPNMSKIDYDNYGVINVAPSVVPNPYLPSFRIFSYNITGIKSTVQDFGSINYVRTTKNRTPKHHGGGKAGNKTKLCKEKIYKDTWKCRLQEPWNSDKEAPSRSNTLWSPLGYAQVRVL